MTTMFDDALSPVRDWLARREHLVVGLMTGTSADAVDAALVRFTGTGLDSTHEVVASRESRLDPALRREVLEVACAQQVPLERLMRLDAALGELYAAAVLELIAASGLPAGQVGAIGSHGQTVRHVPRHEGGGQALTLQIGSAAVLAERTGLTVVSDFRARDVAAGGEGAPLVPLVDWWLFRSPVESRVLLNLGGMANVTFLPQGGALADVVAFDTGPGNAILDALAALASGDVATHDQGGASALRGKVNEALLAELLADPFFELPPPRSTGRERFGAPYAKRVRERGRELGLSDDDLMATAVELTAASVAQSIARFIAQRTPVEAVIASGGGVHNPALMGALSRRLGPARLERSDDHGVPAGIKEALAFAFLAHQTLCGLPGNAPGATGAVRPVVLGHITPGAARAGAR
jgi:anhydro-N-acetylmuramic acid kinase